MDYVMLFAFSAIVAIAYNAIFPKVSNNATIAKINGSYAGSTAIMAAVIFASIVLSSMLMGLVSKKALGEAKSAI